VHSTEKPEKKDVNVSYIAVLTEKGLGRFRGLTGFENG
jgi:hypothetical protein